MRFGSHELWILVQPGQNTVADISSARTRKIVYTERFKTIFNIKVGMMMKLSMRGLEKSRQKEISVLSKTVAISLCRRKRVQVIFAS